MTAPSAHPPSYLQEAAAELRKASAVLVHSVQDPVGAAAEHRRIAEGFTRLAAIEAGLPPCCHRVQPGQEPQPCS
jgi:hypothetical protein